MSHAPLPTNVAVHIPGPSADIPGLRRPLSYALAYHRSPFSRSHTHISRQMKIGTGSPTEPPVVVGRIKLVGNMLEEIDEGDLSGEAYKGDVKRIGWIDEEWEGRQRYFSGANATRVRDVAVQTVDLSTKGDDKKSFLEKNRQEEARKLQRQSEIASIGYGRSDNQIVGCSNGRLPFLHTFKQH